MLLFLGDDPFRQYSDSEQRASVGSYASVKIRNSRFDHPSLPENFQMTERPMRSPPNTFLTDDHTFTHSVFDVESSSGASTFHESPQAHPNSKELSSIF